jgi:hypothetical protein
MTDAAFAGEGMPRRVVCEVGDWDLTAACNPTQVSCSAAVFELGLDAPADAACDWATLAVGVLSRRRRVDRGRMSHTPSGGRSPWFWLANYALCCTVAAVGLHESSSLSWMQILHSSPFVVALISGGALWFYMAFWSPYQRRKR